MRTARETGRTYDLDRDDLVILGEDLVDGLAAEPLLMQERRRRVKQREWHAPTIGTPSQLHEPTRRSTLAGNAVWTFVVVAAAERSGNADSMLTRDNDVATAETWP